MLPMISGQAVDPVRAVAAFGDKMMVSLSDSGKLQGAGSSAYAHFAPGGAFDPSYKDSFRGWAPFGFEQNRTLEHAFANTDVVCMAAGSYHTVAVTGDRRVYSWGANSEFNYGEDYLDGVLLGYSTSEKAVQLHASRVLESTLWTPPAAKTIPTLITVLERQQIRQVACGAVHSLALADNGKVYSWGVGTNGRLGHASSEHPGDPEIDKSEVAPKMIFALSELVVTQVACGDTHSLAVTANGYLYSWGDNSSHQLGVQLPQAVGDALPAPPRALGKPLQVRFDSAVCVVQACGSTSHSLAMDVEGRVFAWGDNCHSDPRRTMIGRLGLPSKGEHLPRQVTAGAMEGAVIRMVAAGQNHSVALTEGGKVLFWGWLRRPNNWKDNGYGAVDSSAQILPGVVHGDWEPDGSVVYVAAGANKVLVVVDPKLAALGDEDTGLSAEGQAFVSQASQLAPRSLSLSALPVALVGKDSGLKKAGKAGNETQGASVEEQQQREIVQLRSHNDKLAARVEELEATVDRARAIFERYLPHAVDSLELHP